MIRRLALALCALALTITPAFAQYVPGYAPGFRGGFQFVGGLPTYDFANGSYPPVSFSRASVAYAADKSGNYTAFSVNSLRITNAGATIEPARTNILLWSQDLSQVWGKTDATATAAAATAPDATQTATLIVEGSAGTASVSQSASATTAGALVGGQIFLKAVSSVTWLEVILTDGAATSGGNFWINLSTGALGTVQARNAATGVVGSVEAAGNGFWRLKMSATYQSGVSNGQMIIRSASADASTTRVANARYYAWQAQIELGSVSSPIKTTNAAASRSVDIASVTIPAGANKINYTFDDGSQQQVSVSPGNYTIPTNLNRAVIARMQVQP